MPKFISCFRWQKMTTDYPESHEITFKEITTAASPTSPRSFISQTQSGHLQHRPAEHRAVRLCPPSPPSFSPSICGLPWDFSLDSPPRLCQDCRDVEVTGYCQQEAGNEIWIAAGGPPSIPPSLPPRCALVLSHRNWEILGGAAKLPHSASCKAAGVKGGGL